MGDPAKATGGGPSLVMPDMSSARGRRLFASKGCVTCHSVNGIGGEDAPNLDAHTMRPRMNPFEFAARMWHGAEAMIAMQEEAFGSKITFTGDELADIIAFAHDDEEQHKFTEADISPKIMALMDHVHSTSGGGGVAHAGELGHSGFHGVESKLVMADPGRFAITAEQAGAAGGVDPQIALPMEEITARVIGAGFSHIHAIKFENGRYEVGARNKSGKDVLLRIDPRSGAVALLRVGAPPEKGSFLTVKTILEEVQGAGFGQVSSIGRRNSIYHIIARDTENRTVKLFIHPKTGGLILHPTSGKPIQKTVEPSHVPTYKSIKGVAARVMEVGFTEVYTIEPEHGGYEVRARAPAGGIVKVYVDAGTGEVLRHP